MVIGDFASCDASDDDLTTGSQGEDHTPASSRASSPQDSEVSELEVLSQVWAITETIDDLVDVPAGVRTESSLFDLRQDIQSDDVVHRAFLSAILVRIALM